MPMPFSFSFLGSHKNTTPLKCPEDPGAPLSADISPEFLAECERKKKKTPK
jgi:hypothetical protein